MYQKGELTRAEYRWQVMQLTPWSKDRNGDEFYFKCHKCQNPLTSCPDPECRGIGHHIIEEDWDCGEDIELDKCERVYRKDLISWTL